MRFTGLLLIGLLAFACGNINPPTPKIFRKALTELPLDTLSLPPGFQIDVYMEDVANARSLELSPNGTLFVGTRDEGNVYAIVDRDGDLHGDTLYTLAEDLNSPNGVAFRNGDLYVAEINRVLRFADIENRLDNPGEPEVIYDQYPEEKHHGWKFIDFGPDGKLYVPVGAPCNICLSEDSIFASITRLDVDTREMEIVHRGIRNTVGFTWHPDTKDLWFTDNGRDMLGDNKPSCELNHAPQDSGMHFGYPFCHQGDLPDPEFGEQRDCAEFTPPAQKLGPHVAPLGVEFYTGEMFPAEFDRRILIAEHGSWNRSEKIGYRLMMVDLNERGDAVSYEPFVTGWLSEEGDVWGRPVDLEFLPDGSLLVSDDFANAIYRIYYEGLEI